MTETTNTISITAVLSKIANMTEDRRDGEIDFMLNMLVHDGEYYFCQQHGVIAEHDVEGDGDNHCGFCFEEDSETLTPVKRIY